MKVTFRKMGQYFFVINKDRKIIVKPKVANWKYCEFSFPEVIKKMGWNAQETIYALGDNLSIILYRTPCNCTIFEDFDHPVECTFKNIDFSDYKRQLLDEETGLVSDSKEDFFDCVIEWLKYEKEEGNILLY